MKKFLFSIVFIFISILGFTQNIKDSSFTNNKLINTKLPDPSDPKELNAEAVNNSRINITWQRNDDNNDVLIAYSTDGVFGIPVYGQVYDKFDNIIGGGEVLYIGSAESYNHASLNEATRYYYKAWSIKNSTPDYSVGIETDEVTHGPPFISKPVITSITLSSADAQAIVISENGASITEKGFVYSLFTNPTISDNKVTVDDESFKITLETLSQHTLHYIKAYATNIYGIGYSKEESFTTSAVTSINIINLETFKVFPNPSTGILNLLLPPEIKSASVLIVDIKGNIILSTKVNSTNTSINLFHIKKGLYILHLKTSNYSFIEKIIIK